MSISSTAVVSTKVGDRELLTSGVVHVEGDIPIHIKIDTLQFVFEFKSDKGGARYSGSLKDGILYFHLFNHNNSFGEGKLTPIEIAILNGRDLSFTYLVNTIDIENKARRFEYAFYLS